MAIVGTPSSGIGSGFYGGSAYGESSFGEGFAASAASESFAAGQATVLGVGTSIFQSAGNSIAGAVLVGVGAWYGSGAGLAAGVATVTAESATVRAGQGQNATVPRRSLRSAQAQSLERARRPARECLGRRRLDLCSSRLGSWRCNCLCPRCGNRKRRWPSDRPCRSLGHRRPYSCRSRHFGWRATADAIGASTVAAQGAASGVATATAVGALRFDAAGTAAGTATAVGIADTGTATGAAAGLATVCWHRRLGLCCRRCRPERGGYFRCRRKHCCCSGYRCWPSERRRVQRERRHGCRHCDYKCRRRKHRECRWRSGWPCHSLGHNGQRRRCGWRGCGFCSRREHCSRTRRCCWCSYDGRCWCKHG